MWGFPLHKCPKKAVNKDAGPLRRERSVKGADRLFIYKKRSSGGARFDMGVHRVKYPCLLDRKHDPRGIFLKKVKLFLPAFCTESHLHFRQNFAQNVPTAKVQPFWEGTQFSDWPQARNVGHFGCATVSVCGGVPPPDAPSERSHSDTIQVI